MDHIFIFILMFSSIQENNLYVGMNNISYFHDQLSRKIVCKLELTMYSSMFYV